MNYARKNARLPLLLAGLWLTAHSGGAVAQSMNASPGPCAHAGSTADTGRCFDSALKTADRDLNKLYGRIQRVLEPEELKELIEAERLWVQYRDAACKAEYDLYGGRSGGPPTRVACLEAETRSREASLERSYEWRLEKFGETPTNVTVGGSAAGIADGDELAQIEGYYPLSGTCFTRSKDGGWEPCGDPGTADSCLLVRKIDAKHAAFRVESNQTDGRECGVSGIATLGSHELNYTQAHDQAADSGRKLVIQVGESTLTLHYPEKGAGTLVDPAFCAANASLEGLKFKRADKLPIGSHTCGD